jgi:formiminoglutamase
LTLDAHLDLRTLEGGLVNGNPVRALLDDGLPGRNIAQVGIQSFSNSFAYAQLAQERELRVIPIEDVHARGVEVVVSEALRELASRADAIYVDLDLDALDRASSPATAASRPGGMTPAQLRLAAKVCGRHPKVRAMDLVEVDPTRDVAEVTVMAAAACLLAFASGVLARTKERPGAGSESSG